MNVNWKANKLMSKTKQVGVPLLDLNLIKLLMWTLSIDSNSLTQTLSVGPNFPHLNLPVLYLYWFTANQFTLDGSQHAWYVPLLTVQYSLFQILSMNTQLPARSKTQLCPLFKSPQHLYSYLEGTLSFSTEWEGSTTALKFVYQYM